ncbi:G-protein beta WD-40 repeats containing protein [Reticulomyxa filosa]|uniref:G-protein beta WD-40 repeats containing protein n=1 Tax=Reticulomyxa filosa TaxID=46433 RepID=X6NPV0_RETFI|nr:G-protein beta WD-40 repeats containing protein [Reticulomyxa filosa]|eukprot:ETO27739.1 G-protein beta WD-40 repeats containing protein [Reticulomyxa filosa]
MYKDEILICGGNNKRECWSYHTLKNQYKYICSYPDNVILQGHCVVSNASDTSDIFLVSFGGPSKKTKHTLIMEYMSVWENAEEKNIKKDTIKRNAWFLLIGANKKPVYIGRNIDDYIGVRAVIGGSNKQLLFITYPPRNISIFNLNTHQFVKHSTFPTGGDNCIRYHCFLSLDDDIMALFCKQTGLFIKYNEDSNELNFQLLQMCSTITGCDRYACVVADGYIWFFGGRDLLSDAQDLVHLYSPLDNTWLQLADPLSIPLMDSAAVFDKGKLCVHIIGGRSTQDIPTVLHVGIGLVDWENSIMDIVENHTWLEWDKREMEDAIRLIEDLNNKAEIKDMINVKKDMDNMKENCDLKNLKSNVGTYYHPSSKNGLTILLKLLHDIFWYMFNFWQITCSRFSQKMKYFKLLKKFRWNPFGTTSVAFALDGSKIVSSVLDQTVRIWDLKFEKEAQILKGHSGSIRDSQFSPKGDMVVSCSEDNTIRLWDVNSGKEIRTFKAHGDVTKCQFAPHSNTLVSSLSNGSISVWDINSGKQQQFQAHNAIVNDVQFSRDGQMIVTSSHDKTIRIWDAISFDSIQILNGHIGPVWRAQFSPDSRFIVSCSYDKTIRIWNVSTGEQLNEFTGHSDVIRNVTFSADGQVIVSCSYDKTIRLWDFKSGQEIQKLEGHLNWVTGVDISPNGNLLQFQEIYYVLKKQKKNFVSGAFFFGKYLLFWNVYINILQQSSFSGIMTKNKRLNIFFGFENVICDDLLQ